RGYRGSHDMDVVSYPNPHDPEPVALFKGRSLNRHENFNSMTKVFAILKGRFRHTEDQFCSAFRAVCVLCHYKVEKEVPLYDILIPAVIDGMGAGDDKRELSASEDETSDSQSEDDSDSESEDDV
ncbi:MAG: hypothetical protein SGILL_008337, partial [Bacillariaceae sp.]